MAHVSTRQLAAAMALYTAGGLFWAFLPFFIGAQEQAGTLSSARAGALGSAYLVGFTVVSLLGPWWLRLWRRTGWTLLAVACVWLGLAILSRGTSYSVLQAACFTVGMGMGAFWVVAFGVFGAAANPQRVFGLAVALGYAILGLATWGIGHMVAPMAGLTGITLTISVLVGTLVLMSLGLSQDQFVVAEVEATEMASHTSGRLSPLLLPLSGVVLLSLSFAAIWAFAERIGHQAGFSAGQIALVLSFNLLVTGTGSLLASVLSTRCPAGWLLLGFGGLMTLCDLALLGITQFPLYLIALCGLGLAVGIGMPVQLGIVARFDRHQRYLPLVAAAQGAGTAIGPALGGLAFEQGGLAMLVPLAAGSAVLCVLVTGLRLLWKHTITE